MHKNELQKEIIELKSIIQDAKNKGKRYVWYKNQRYSLNQMCVRLNKAEKILRTRKF